LIYGIFSIDLPISGHVRSENSEDSEGSRDNTGLANKQQLRNDKESGSSKAGVIIEGSIGNTPLSDKHGNNEETRGIDTAATEKSKIESINTNQITSTSTITSNSSDLVDCFWPNNQDKQHPLSPIEPSQLSQPSLQVAGTRHNTIHRLGRSDIFGCDNCKLRGDRWEMEKHPCRGLL
jgi:hypothetical protein